MDNLLYQPQPYQPDGNGRQVLLLVGSPLQVLIAERIIALHPEDTFDTVLLTTGIIEPNAKYEYYFERLKKISRNAWYVERYSNLSRREFYLNILKLLKLSLFLPVYDRIYHGAQCAESGLFLTRQRKAEVHTLDDGSANLSRTSMNKIKHVSNDRLLRLIYKLLPHTQSVDSIAKSSKHITIYNLPHTHPLAHYMPLVHEPVKTNTSRSQVLKIMLGQPVYHLVKAKSKDLENTQAIVDCYQITKYLPHPKEKYRVERTEYIDSPFISEDWILTYLREHPDTSIEVYGFCSSTIFNLQGIDGLKFICILPEDSPEYMLEVYDVAAGLSNTTVKRVHIEDDGTLREL